jgi:hypothetical protein
MTVCKSCKRSFRPSQKGVCPYCGRGAATVRAGVMKTSTIFVAAAGADAVYRSVEEVPASIKKKLLRSTSGSNAATIVIADKRGREELKKALLRLPGDGPETTGSFAWREAMGFSVQQLLAFAVLVAALILLGLSVR